MNPTHTFRVPLLLAALLLAAVACEAEVIELPPAPCIHGDGDGAGGAFLVPVDGGTDAGDAAP